MNAFIGTSAYHARNPVSSSSASNEEELAGDEREWRVNVQPGVKRIGSVGKKVGMTRRNIIWWKFGGMTCYPTWNEERRNARLARAAGGGTMGSEIDVEDIAVGPATTSDVKTDIKEHQLPPGWPSTPGHTGIFTHWDMNRKGTYHRKIQSKYAPALLVNTCRVKHWSLGDECEPFLPKWNGVKEMAYKWQSSSVEELSEHILVVSPKHLTPSCLTMCSWASGLPESFFDQDGVGIVIGGGKCLNAVNELAKGREIYEITVSEFVPICQAPIGVPEWEKEALYMFNFSVPELTRLAYDLQCKSSAVRGINLIETTSALLGAVKSVGLCHTEPNLRDVSKRPIYDQIPKSGRKVAKFKGTKFAKMDSRLGVKSKGLEEALLLSMIPHCLPTELPLLQDECFQAAFFKGVTSFPNVAPNKLSQSEMKLLFEKVKDVLIAENAALRKTSEENITTHVKAAGEFLNRLLLCPTLQSILRFIIVHDPDFMTFEEVSNKRSVGAPEGDMRRSLFLIICFAVKRLSGSVSRDKRNKMLVNMKAVFDSCDVTTRYLNGLLEVKEKGKYDMSNAEGFKFKVANDFMPFGEKRKSITLPTFVVSMLGKRGISHMTGIPAKEIVASLVNQGERQDLEETLKMNGSHIQNFLAYVSNLDIAGVAGAGVPILNNIVAPLRLKGKEYASGDDALGYTGGSSVVYGKDGTPLSKELVAIEKAAAKMNKAAGKKRMALQKSVSTMRKRSAAQGRSIPKSARLAIEDVERGIAVDKTDLGEDSDTAGPFVKRKTRRLSRDRRAHIVDDASSDEIPGDEDDGVVETENRPECLGASQSAQAQAACAAAVTPLTPADVPKTTADKDSKLAAMDLVLQSPRSFSRKKSGDSGNGRSGNASPEDPIRRGNSPGISGESGNGSTEKTSPAFVADEDLTGLSGRPGDEVDKSMGADREYFPPIPRYARNGSIKNVTGGVAHYPALPVTPPVLPVPVNRRSRGSERTVTDVDTPMPDLPDGDGGTDVKRSKRSAPSGGKPLSTGLRSSPVGASNKTKSSSQTEEDADRDSIMADAERIRAKRCSTGSSGSRGGGVVASAASPVTKPKATFIPETPEANIDTAPEKVYARIDLAEFKAAERMLAERKKVGKTVFGDGKEIEEDVGDHGDSDGLDSDEPIGSWRRTGKRSREEVKAAARITAGQSDDDSDTGSKEEVKPAARITAGQADDESEKGSGEESGDEGNESDGYDSESESSSESSSSDDEEVTQDEARLKIQQQVTDRMLKHFPAPRRLGNRAHVPAKGSKNDAIVRQLILARVQEFPIYQEFIGEGQFSRQATCTKVKLGEFIRASQRDRGVRSLDLNGHKRSQYTNEGEQNALFGPSFHQGMCALYGPALSAVVPIQQHLEEVYWDDHIRGRFSSEMTRPGWFEKKYTNVEQKSSYCVSWLRVVRGFFNPRRCRRIGDDPDLLTRAYDLGMHAGPVRGVKLSYEEYTIIVDQAAKSHRRFIPAGGVLKPLTFYTTRLTAMESSFPWCGKDGEVRPEDERPSQRWKEGTARFEKVQLRGTKVVARLHDLVVSSRWEDDQRAKDVPRPAKLEAETRMGEKLSDTNEEIVLFEMHPSIPGAWITPNKNMWDYGSELVRGIIVRAQARSESEIGELELTAHVVQLLAQRCAEQGLKVTARTREGSTIDCCMGQLMINLMSREVATKCDDLDCLDLLESSVANVSNNGYSLGLPLEFGGRRAGIRMAAITEGDSFRSLHVERNALVFSGFAPTAGVNSKPDLKDGLYSDRERKEMLEGENIVLAESVMPRTYEDCEGALELKKSRPSLPIWERTNCAGLIKSDLKVRNEAYGMSRDGRSRATMNWRLSLASLCPVLMWDVEWDKK